MWKKHEKASGIHRKRLTDFSGRSMSERLQAETRLEEKMFGEKFMLREQSGFYIPRRKLKGKERCPCPKSSVSWWRGSAKRPKLESPKFQLTSHSHFHFTKPWHIYKR